MITNYSTVLKTLLFLNHSKRRLMLFSGALPAFDMGLSEEDMLQVLKARSSDFIATYELIPILSGKSLSYTDSVEYGTPNWNKSALVTNLLYSQANDEASLSHKVASKLYSASEPLPIPTWFAVLEGDWEQVENVTGGIEFLGSVGVGDTVSSKDLLVITKSSAPGQAPDPVNMLPVRVPL